MTLSVSPGPGKRLKRMKNGTRPSGKNTRQDVIAKDISDTLRDFGDLVQDTGQQLRRFSDYECLPGHCELCRVGRE